MSIMQGKKKIVGQVCVYQRSFAIRLLRTFITITCVVNLLERPNYAIFLYFILFYFFDIRSFLLSMELFPWAIFSWKTFWEMWSPLFSELPCCSKILWTSLAYDTAQWGRQCRMLILLPLKTTLPLVISLMRHQDVFVTRPVPNRSLLADAMSVCIPGVFTHHPRSSCTHGGTVHPRGHVSSSPDEQRGQQSGHVVAFRIGRAVSYSLPLTKEILEPVPRIPAFNEIWKVLSSSYSVDLSLCWAFHF